MQELNFSIVPQSAGLEALIVKSQKLAAASQAESTRRAMESSWRDIESWTRQHGFPSLIHAPSPEVVALYLTDRANSLSPQTLTKRLWSITQALCNSGYDGPSPASTRQPLVRAVMRGIRRSKGVAPGRNRKEPLLTNQIRLLTGVCGDDLQGLRNRALVLTGFAGGGIRREELSIIDRSQLEFCEAGVIYHQGRSKTDQDGSECRMVAIPFGTDPETCAVRALRSWLDAAGIKTGPVFRTIHRRGTRQVVGTDALSAGAVTYIVKRLARRAGLDDKRYGAHSLRSGFCTQAAVLGKVGARAVMRHSGHKDAKSFERYVRPEFGDDNVANHLGL